MPVDMKLLQKVLSRLYGNKQVDMVMSHEQIVNLSIYNRAIQDVLSCLEGIENGTINVQEYVKNQ